MSYVITCGDEGVQINEGKRLGVVGAGFRLEGFSEVVKSLKKLLGDDLRIASNEENAWVKEKLDLSTWEQTNASSQQHIEAVADDEKLLYAGYLPFSDPQVLKHDIKGHMVRPQKIHIAMKIAFTLAGGEQTFNLGQNIISAEWVHLVKPELAKKIIKEQVDFFQKIAGDFKLKFVFEEEGELGEEIAAKNKAILEKLGFKAS
ncbi:MAG: hypothetical protein OEX81_04230 [Candidatus Pacebacteria bacterium]|nr:hypothetical protein [Candidatus Paceibacterota bacterium]